MNTNIQADEVRQTDGHRFRCVREFVTSGLQVFFILKELGRHLELLE